MTLAQGKISGSQKARHFLNSFLDDTIIAPCRAGARVYGCDFDSDGFLKMMRDVNADYAKTKAYAIGGLSIEALFLRKTIASFYMILGSVIVRLAISAGNGTAMAAADARGRIGTDELVLALDAHEGMSESYHEVRTDATLSTGDLVRMRIVAIDGVGHLMAEPV